MPRIKPPPSEQRSVKFKAAVAHNMYLLGIGSMKELAPRLSMSPSGLCRRMKAPESFSAAELYKLYCVLQFTDEQKLLLLKN